MACFVALLSTAAAGQQPYQSSNDYGSIGLLQIPTARLSGAGEVRLGYSQVSPYNNYSFSAQPFDWFEATYSYIDLTNRPFGESNDSTLDKSFDFKFRLFKESSWMPATSVGIIDIGGTGLLSSEYIVASKRWSNFDFSAGMGWGRLASRGAFRNPVSILSEQHGEFRQEGTADVEKAGKFAFGDLFSGEQVGIFGGIRWQPEGAPYSVIVERESNDYTREPYGNDLKVHWPINIGLTYKTAVADFGLSYERGDEIGFRITFGTNFDSANMPPKVLDPPPSPVAPPLSADISSAPSSAPPGPGAAEEEFVKHLREALERQRFGLYAIEFKPSAGEATIWFTQDSFRNETTALGRVARSASALAPEIYQHFVLVSVAGPVENYRATIERSDVREVASGSATVDELLSSTLFSPPYADRPLSSSDTLAQYPLVDWGIGPRTRQSIGDPDNFIYGQLWLALNGSVRLTERLDVSALVGVDIVNNFDEITRDSDSKLPRVRSETARYLKEGDTGLVRLYANYIWPIAPNWYGRLSAGLLEQMYGGVAGEVLYRPFGSNWAVSLDANRVRKRDYDQRFDFLNYEVTTGHATLYYKHVPTNVLLKLSAGQYLAGDRGATVDVSRQFKTGARIGAFATKTNVSADEFGEGAFDKGFYVSIPLDFFSQRSSKRQAFFMLRPLTRDGGQKVSDGPELYNTTTGSDLDAVADTWGDWTH